MRLPYGLSALGIALITSIWASDPVMAGPTSAIRRPNHLSPFACSGSVEKRVWALWDGVIKDSVRNDLIEKRLLSTGDTYALYDLQTTLSNLVAMAHRCGRHSRLVQLADLLLPVFNGMETLLPPNEHHQGWVCRGGSLCTKANRRLGREVLLVSLQGLGLLTDLASRLANYPNSSFQQHSFVGLTASASQSHLERMATPELRDSLRLRLQAKPVDVKGNSSGLLFTSGDIWRYTIAMNTAAFSAESWYPSKAVRGMVRDTAHLFAKRTTIDSRSASPRANLDAHFWDRRVDHAYAGYDGVVSPVKCVRHQGKLRAVLRNPLIPRQPVSGTGWDISHARRLVPLFEAVERNGSQASATFGIPFGLLPTRLVRDAYTNQLADVIWNQDPKYPLFSNYWGGANGWYRVAYKPGNGSCRIGYPPFGLTSAFPQGGFITWKVYKPQLGDLGVSLFRLSISTRPSDRVFVTKYYPQLAVPDDAPGPRQYGKLQFWSSLIGLN
ncbi:hypothetical protein [Synechococcus sp. MIT S9509]|uniref:hypothetical protein n=1 Tax=Synechococcus sp. MIT S9509 TaxID=1801630 RepID=UPI0012E9067B|nr:hypothetical protein [Synechococcus sp. MIT S9509]